MTTAFEIRRVSKKDTQARKLYAGMLHDNLYAADVDPLKDINMAEVIFAAHGLQGDVGFVLVSHYASPDEDQVGPGFWWLENTVVQKNWRREGVADALEFAGREFLRKRLIKKPSKRVKILRATIDSRRPHQLERNGWIPERKAFDSATKKPSVVFRLPERLL